MPGARQPREVRGPRRPLSSRDCAVAPRTVQPILDLARTHAEQLPAAVTESLAEVGDMTYADDLRERLIPAVRAHCAELSQRLR